MNEDAKNAIKELKEVVLEFHRTAGKLDDIVREIESTKESGDYLSIFIRAKRLYREDVKSQNDYKNLDKREEHAWNKLIDATKSES